MLKFIIELMFRGVFPCFIGLGGSQFSGAAANNTNQAQQAAGQYGSAASGEGAALNPFFSQEMKATHAYDPNQINEMLTAAEGGAGGAFGGAEGQINANAARTGNATSVTKSLDEMAREKAKTAAGASEGIAAQDVAGAKALNQEGAKGMEGLYGTNVGAQLGAMKQSDADVAQQQALNPGWLKGAEGVVSTLGNAAGGAASFVNSNPNGIFGG